MLKEEVKKTYVFKLFGGKMRVTAVTLDNSKPRYLEQILISLGCWRYRGSTVPSNTDIINI